MDPIVGGIPLLLVIFGLVEFCKKFNLSGKWLTLVSMLLGIVLGVVYQASLKYTILNQYFEWVVFGLACGLSASGLYDFVDKRTVRQDKPALIASPPTGYTNTTYPPPT